VVKLIIFSLMAIVVPLTIFYASQSFGFSSTFAGISAGISANLVLILYVIVAFIEQD
jgi:VMA21-like domain